MIRVVVIALILCCPLLGKRGTVSAPSAQPSIADLSATGSLSSRAVGEGDLVQFTLMIRNKSDARTVPPAVARSIRLLALPPQYQFEKICVLPSPPGQSDLCQTGSQFSQFKSLVWDALSPGQSISVQGELKAVKGHKAASLPVTIVWSVVSGSNSPSWAQSVSLGDIQVRSTGQALWAFSTDFVIKFLGIPALVLFALNWLATRRDKRTADAERQRALRAETWKQMLLVSHKYAAECYLPLSLASERLAQSLETLSSPNGNPKVAFYYLLLCGKRMAKTRKDTGGFYFKDLRGEKWAAECWRRFRETLLGNDEDAPFHLAAISSIDAIAEIETYAAFKTKFEIVGTAVTYNDAVIESAWSLFQTVIQIQKVSIPEVIAALKGFAAALDYESNRPYKYWYDVRDKLSLEPQIAKLFTQILTTDGRFTPQQIVCCWTRRGRRVSVSSVTP